VVPSFAKGSEAAFEQVSMSRDSHLEKVSGFVEFHSLRGPEAEDRVFHSPHSVWENRARGMDQIRGVPGSAQSGRAFIFYCCKSVT
jgi:heme-degrading monooxygenase HmoA